MRWQLQGRGRSEWLGPTRHGRKNRGDLRAPVLRSNGFSDGRLERKKTEKWRLRKRPERTGAWELNHLMLTESRTCGFISPDLPRLERLLDPDLGPLTKVTFFNLPSGA